MPIQFFQQMVVHAVVYMYACIYYTAWDMTSHHITMCIKSIPVLPTVFLPLQVPMDKCLYIKMF